MLRNDWDAVVDKRKQIADAAREGAGSAICTHWCAQCRIPAPSSCTKPLAHSAERGVEHATKGMRDAEQGTKGMEEKLPDPSDTPSDPPESPWSRPFVLEVFTRRPFLGVFHCTPCRCRARSAQELPPGDNIMPSPQASKKPAMAPKHAFATLGGK